MTTPLYKFSLALGCAVFSGLLAGMVGCTTAVFSRAPDGTVRAEYYSFLKQTSVDELVVPTSGGPASLKGGKGDASAVGLETIDKLVDRLPTR
jgi:hypothetical protein